MPIFEENGTYELWTKGIRTGDLIIKTNDIGRISDVSPEYPNSCFFNIQNVNKDAVVVIPSGSLKVHDKVKVLQLESVGIQATVKDAIGEVHKISLNNLIFE